MPYESELASLLTDLLAGQNELLDILSRKRQLLAASDLDGLAAIGADEQRLILALQECLQRREDLLRRARQEGMPSANLQTLSKSLPRSQRDRLDPQVQLARSRARLLQHHSLTNWVIVQRTLIHLSQLLEIIATGGRLQPTYGRGPAAHTSGNLVDRAA